MTKEYKAILKDLIKEYELLAKYNGAKDYLRWNALRDALVEIKNSDLNLYAEAITDVDFIEMNYGIKDIDIQFVRSFNPHQLLSDYKEWKNEQIKKTFS